MKRVVCAVALAGLLAGGAALRATQQRPPEPEPDPPGRGTVAVLRRDGFVIPFAAIDRSGWTAHWPMALQNIDIPITLDAIPRQWWGTGRMPSAWRAWAPAGTSQPVKVLGPSLQRLQCATRLALRTDYRSKEPLPPAPVDPFPKDGLVLGGALELEPIESVENAEQRAALAVALLDEFNRVETNTVRDVRSASSWRHPVAEAIRRKTAVRIESWYRAPTREPGTMLSFVEGVRSYPPGPEDEGCGLETLFSGWVFSTDKELVARTELFARVTYCDRVGALYMLPFGRLHANGKLHWIVQMSGWDEEWYTIAQVERRSVRIVLEFLAATRRSCGR